MNRLKLAYSWIVLAALAMAASFYSGRYYFMSPVCTAYPIISFGTISFPKAPILSDGEYSYGIYLYGWLLPQMHMHYFPEFRDWRFNMLFTVPITVLIAFLSWNIIEKRALYLKNHPRMRRFMAYPVRHRSLKALSLLRGSHSG